MSPPSLTPDTHSSAPATSSEPRSPVSEDASMTTTTLKPAVTIAEPETRPTSFPFTFRRPFLPNLSSTSLVPSTAEGKPIPVDDSTAQNRTSALRQLNKTNPRRHRYERSTGAQSSTYSEPVIVRSYYNPVSNHPSTRPRAGGIIVTNRRAQPRPHLAETTTTLTQSMPFAGKAASARDGVLNGVAKVTGKKMWGNDTTEEAKLPPIEAFTFKSFMQNIDAQASGADLNADLDRIAEICARSRYSLSNQYEVHYAPHGSGASFLGAGSSEAEIPGPTLQVITEEESSTGSKRRRHGTRRNSKAMGTLETIMSSSRSSDEDKTHRKSAAELADEIRGRVARLEPGDTSPAYTTQSIEELGIVVEGAQSSAQTRARRKSMSLALIEGQQTHGEEATPRISASALVGEPALPQTSTRQLEIRSAPEALSTDSGQYHPHTPSARLSGSANCKAPAAATKSVEDGLFSSWSSWMPWTASPPSSSSAEVGRSAPTRSGRAEGSLRDLLLKTADAKGKEVEQ